MTIATGSVCPMPSKPPRVFSTERLPLAIFLHASQQLPFRGCEANESGKVRFLFQDSADNGSQAELEFDRGASVPATAIFASQKFLRRRMSAALENRKIENYVTSK